MAAILEATGNKPESIYPAEDFMRAISKLEKQLDAFEAKKSV